MTKITTARNPEWPEWCVVGARLQLVNSIGASRVRKEVTVERFTKTQVILSNGERFRLGDIAVTGSCLYRPTGKWSTSRLLPLGQDL